MTTFPILASILSRIPSHLFSHIARSGVPSVPP